MNTTDPYWWASNKPNNNLRHSTISGYQDLVSNTWLKIHNLLGAANDARSVSLSNIWDSSGNSNVLPFPSNIESISKRESHIPIEDATSQDIGKIFALYKDHELAGHLRPRSMEYITGNIDNFLTIQIDGKLAGCVEIIQIDDDTIELWGIVVATAFQNMNMSWLLIDSVEWYAQIRSLNIISVTDSKVLANIYKKRGYILRSSGEYDERAKQSPTKAIYKKLYRNNVYELEYPKYIESWAKLA